jgi:hypothetical protein
MANPRKALDQLLISRVRVKLLKYFLMNPETPIHLRAAVRELKEEINAVRRELMRLEEVDVLKSDTRGNRKYFTLNQDSPFFDELRGMVFKTFGLGGEVSRNVNKLGHVNFAILTGAYLTGGVITSSQPVDLVLIGDIDAQAVTELVETYEKKESKQVNYTVFTAKEFELRKKRNDSFIMEILVMPKLMLVGRQEDLLL